MLTPEPNIPTEDVPTQENVSNAKSKIKKIFFMFFLILNKYHKFFF